MLELVHFFDKIKQVKALVFDVDGVFTNNTCLVTENGEMLRTMSLRDGLAVKMAVYAGFKIGIITGGRSQGVARRFDTLGVRDVFLGVSDKNASLDDFLQVNGLSPADVLYVGDDLPDLPVLKRVGIGVAPADAVPEVLSFVDYISPLNGGQGCVRDVIEKVMKVQEKWDDAVRAVAFAAHG